MIFEKFGIREGARVLDLASGIGRMSVNLAKAGFEVVGVDISPFYLEYATRWARKENVADRAQFYKFDMRDAARQLRKKGEEKFDGVINFGTSTGITERRRTYGHSRVYSALHLRVPSWSLTR